MKISRSSLAHIVLERMNDKSVSTQDLSQEVAAYLLAEGQTSELDSLMRDVMQLRADNGLVEVQAHSAHGLSADVRKDIESIVREVQPNATSIVVADVADPDLIGGVKLEFANEQLDLSVRAKLNRFKQLTAATGGPS